MQEAEMNRSADNTEGKAPPVAATASPHMPDAVTGMTLTPVREGGRGLDFLTYTVKLMGRWARGGGSELRFGLGHLHKPLQ